MYAFNYGGHFFLQLARLHDPAKPLQVEIHPGLHCDRYQCPHCFGHGQRPLPGRVLSAAEFGRALDDVMAVDPLIIVSGITTEPLTHPEAPALLHAIRSRGLRLGLYTKGLRFDAACADAVLQGEAECFVTFSLDAFEREQYRSLHGIRPGGAGRGEGTAGEDYFEKVTANIAAAYAEKRRRNARAELRIAILLFREALEADLPAAIRPLTGMADLVRIAVAQERNDGHRPENLPEARAALLHDLALRFADNPKVRVLEDTADPTRDRGFRHCHTQRFQVTIDKSGNLYPCPQVAVSPYGHLSFGNLRDAPLGELLRSPARQRMFGWEVDAMRCRICDRKDEAINRAVDRLDRAPAPAPQRHDDSPAPLPPPRRPDDAPPLRAAAPAATAQRGDRF